MERFYFISKKLQSVYIDLGIVVPLYKALILYVSNMSYALCIQKKK